jgi:hypothetical protein
MGSTTSQSNDTLQTILHSTLGATTTRRRTPPQYTLLQATMPGGNLVAVDYVGGEQVLSETHASMRVVFHDFLAMILPHDRDQFTAMVTNGDLNFTPWRT